MGCELACKSIVLYCKSGGRSALAIQMLQDQGFQAKMYNGMGIKQWTAAGYDLVTADSVPPNEGCSATTSVTGMNCSATTDVESVQWDLGVADASTAVGGGTVSAALAASIATVAFVFSHA